MVYALLTFSMTLRTTRSLRILKSNLGRCDGTVCRPALGAAYPSLAGIWVGRGQLSNVCQLQLWVRVLRALKDLSVAEFSMLLELVTV